MNKITYDLISDILRVWNPGKLLPKAPNDEYDIHIIEIKNAYYSGNLTQCLCEIIMHYWGGLSTQELCEAEDILDVSEQIAIILYDSSTSK